MDMIDVVPHIDRLYIQDPMVDGKTVLRGYVDDYRLHDEGNARCWFVLDVTGADYKAIDEIVDRTISQKVDHLLVSVVWNIRESFVLRENKLLLSKEWEQSLVDVLALVEFGHPWELVNEIKESNCQGSLFTYECWTHKDELDEGGCIAGDNWEMIINCAYSPSDVMGNKGMQAKLVEYSIETSADIYRRILSFGTFDEVTKMYLQCVGGDSIEIPIL